jgi:hypothetical protein
MPLGDRLGEMLGVVRQQAVGFAWRLPRAARGRLRVGLDFGSNHPVFIGVGNQFRICQLDQAVIVVNQLVRIGW